MNELISRQAAIDAIYGITAYKGTIPLGSAIFNINKIPAAQPEPCEDAVSREEAIDALCANCRVDTPETCLTIQSDSKWCEEVYILQHLPSVTPKQRTGKWIKLDMHRGMADHKCTACEQECYVPTCMGEPMYVFCPNCGAKMEVNNESN